MKTKNVFFKIIIKNIKKNKVISLILMLNNTERGINKGRGEI